MPLELQPGQVGVKCGSGTFVKWLSGTGSYVLQGDPVIELCPPEADRSVTCLAGASGYLVAEQAIGPGDDINETVPDGHLAIIEERVVKQDDGKPVKCAPGTVFESFLVSLGDVVQPGDAVALTLPTAGGGLTHCRTDVGGRVVALKNDLQEGQDLASVCPDLVVAYIGPPYENGQSQEPASATLLRPAHGGDMTIEVDNEDEFDVGNLIRISSGSLSETATIVGIGSINLDHGLRNSYPAGATITKLQDSGDGGGASGPPESWRPRSSLFHEEGDAGFQQSDDTRSPGAPGAAQDPADPAAAELGAAAAVLRTQRRLWVGYGPGSQECTPMSARASSTTTTVPSATNTVETATETTTSTTADHVVEISFDANFSEVLATDHDKEMLKQLLHNKYKTHGCKQVLDLRPGSIIARLQMGHSVDPDMLKALGCVELKHKGRMLCPYGVQQPKSDFLASTHMPPGGRGGLIGIMWMIAALVILGCLGLFGLACWSHRSKTDYSPIPSDPVDTGVQLEFRDSIGRVQRKTFNYQPHGMVLARSGKVRVENFVTPNSYAKELGVQEHWRISKIGDREVAEGATFSDVDHRLRTALQKLPAHPLRIDFKTTGSRDEIERKDFENSPIGLDVSFKAPFKVEHIAQNGQAYGQGVREGWEVIRIGHEVITRDTLSSQVHEWLETAEQHLPPEDYNKAVRLDVLDAHDHQHIVHLDRHGHGMKLERQQGGPVQVKSFTCCSYASRKSVQEGMTVLKVDGHDVGTQGAESIEDLISSKTERFAPLPLKVVFDAGHNSHQTVLFDRQPLGIDVSPTAPFKVTEFHVDSYAAEKGVRKGWSFVKIGTKDVSHVSDLEEFTAVLNEGTDHLPQVDRGLEVEFSDNGRRRIIFFNRWPFGMDLSERAPTSVVNFAFNSYAKERGVRKDWQIVRIHNDSGLQKQSPGDVRQLLEKHARLFHLEARPWPLRVEFKIGQAGLNSLRTIDFEKKPLGIVLSRGPTFKVDYFKPDSHAKELDVELDWEVTKIGQQKVGATHSCSFPQKCLSDGSEHLPEMQGPHMVVEFDTGNHKMETFWLRRRPLGFTVDDHHKVQLFSFNSYASDLGIEPEWRVTRVGSEQVTHSTTGHQINDWLHRQSAELPPWPLRIAFNSGHNGVKTMFFERADLGILWSERLPMRVEGFEQNSYAADMGVRTGWVVAEVGDKGANKLSLETMKRLLEEGQAHLDHDASGLRVEFSDEHGNVHSKVFEYMPSGISWRLHDTVPKVEGLSFNSYAQSLGVQAGWTVKRLGQTNMSHLSGAEVDHIWKEKESANGLKQWPLRITFRTGTSSSRKGHESSHTVSFPCQPLGIVFRDRAPIKIAKLEPLHEDDASNQSVEKGWVVTHIADEDVTQMKKEKVLKLLELGLKPLRYKPLPTSSIFQRSTTTESMGAADVRGRGDTPPGIKPYASGCNNLWPHLHC